MRLPQSFPPDSAILPSSVIPGVSDNARVNRAIVDNAVVQHVVPRLPALLERGYEIALDPDVSESVSLDAIKYFVDRVAGKPQASLSVEATSLSLSAQLPPEEVAARLEALRPRPPSSPVQSPA